jgi:hypothetical protein
MKIRIAAVILCGIALYYGDRAFAIDGTSAQRQTFVAAVPCPSTGVKGYVYCPKKPTDGSAWVQTHDIRWAVPKCAAGFVDAWTNLQWVAVADLRAKDLAATCPPPPPAGTPPCVATFAPWSSPDARGVQTTGVVSVSPLPCQFNAAPATARCAPKPAIVTVLPDPKFPGGGAALPACSYTYGAYGMCNNGVRTRAVLGNGAAMCAGWADLCQACAVADRYADCVANPVDESLDCDFRGVCTVKRVARDCSAFKVAQ